jgi:hypothetical protein
MVADMIPVDHYMRKSLGGGLAAYPWVFGWVMGSVRACRVSVTHVKNETLLTP